VVEDRDLGHAAADDTLRPVVNRRPSLTIVAPSASPEEAAAVIAAVEQFMRDTAPPLAPPAPRTNPWLRAALLEATNREPDEPSPWGDPIPWGA
jgi:hypothetical protein